MKVTMLVGNIASSKTSLARSQKNATIISRDDCRRVFASYLGKEYLRGKRLEDFVNEVVLNMFEGALHLQTPHIMLDETNMSVEDRAIYLLLAQKYGYDVEAIVFPDKGEDVHVERRMKQGGYGDTTKEMWREVYQGNKERYEQPSYDEGFQRIVFLKEESDES